jgi:excisionase family DNA binding protein
MLLSLRPSTSVVGFFIFYYSIRKETHHMEQSRLTGGQMPTDEEVLTLEELAGTLKVKKSWIYAHTRKGTIPHFSVGKYKRFYLSQVLAWLSK